MSGRSERAERSYDVELHAALATLVVLLDDPKDELHKGGEPGGRAAVLVDDLWVAWATTAGDRVIHANDELLGEFTRRRRPRKFVTTSIDDSGCRYVAPAADEPRDSELLALAAVRALAQVVATDATGRRAWHWLRDLDRDMTADLWLSPSELSEVNSMITAIDAALDARYLPRRKGRR